jgi:hypothetical protein
MRRAWRFTMPGTWSNSLQPETNHRRSCSVFRKALKKKRTLVTLAVVGVLAIAGAAFAYWTTTGSGSGSGSVSSTAGPLTLHGTISSALSPGGNSKVAFTADNANGSSELVGTIHAEVAVDAEHAAAGCKASDFAIADTAENQVIAAGASGVELAHEGLITMADTTENQDACQGATISLALTS